jgi:hypothetical protein
MQGLELGQSALLLDMLLQIAALTEFRHDVYVVFGHEYLDRPQDMWVCERPQCVDLIVEEVLFDFGLYLGEFEDLDGDGFLGELVDSLEDFGAEAAADHLKWVVDVVLYLLDHLLLLLHDHLAQ